MRLVAYFLWIWCYTATKYISYSLKTFLGARVHFSYWRRKQIPIRNASFTYIFCIFGTPRDEQSLHYVFLKGKSLISWHSGSFSNRTQLHGFSWKETFHLTGSCYCLHKQTLRNYVVVWEAKFSLYMQSQQTARTHLLQWDRTMSALKRSNSD